MLMKVLIVDDDFFITTALKTILEADPEIQVCGLGKNGKEALSLYASLDPDILLMACSLLPFWMTNTLSRL